MMKTGRLVRGVVISLAAFGICIPPVALAAEPTQMPVVTDVALRDGGMLQGKVVDLQGAGVAGDAIVYTQYGYGPGAMKMFFANPIVIAGLVATAIAVPIALSNAHPASP